MDPTRRDSGNDGSAAHPGAASRKCSRGGWWRVSGWETVALSAGSRAGARNPGAPVQAGDTIYLRSGYHGELVIDGFYNRDFITITAEAGHTPKLGRIRIRSSAGWVIRGLQVSPEFAPSYRRQHADRSRSRTASAVRSTISSSKQCHAAVGARTRPTGAPRTGTRARATGSRWTATDMTVRDCAFRNVNFGISVDGLRIRWSNATRSRTSPATACAAWATTRRSSTTWSRTATTSTTTTTTASSPGRAGRRRVGTGEVRGIVLRGNTIINYEDPNQPHRGTLQGIGCFDGMFVDWVVENNVVIIDHYHGITLSGARELPHREQHGDRSATTAAPARPGSASGVTRTGRRPPAAWSATTWRRR